ncbi:MAG: Major Facilitator Superfamily protein [Syntrophorhabdus sp. PtaU1.Bin050]|nr:MAG: Major Facilitator Superfamily protein [Syntrophorhabdus sp. PtaU1.Bin050]
MHPSLPSGYLQPLEIKSRMDSIVDSQPVPSRTPEKILGKEFLILNGTFFLAAITMALFFKFYQYLHFLGIDPGWYGFIIAADSLAGLFLQPVLSPLLHPGNARRWMSAGIALIILALFLYRTAVTVPWLIAVRILHGAGFIIFISAMMAMIVAYIPAQKSGQAFSFISTVRLLPYAIMPAVVSPLVKTPEGFIDTLWYAILLMALSLFLLIFLKSGTLRANPAGKTARINGRELFDDIKERNVAILLIVNLLLYSGYTAVFFFLERFGKNAGIGNPGLFFTIATIVMICVRLAGITFFDKTNKVLLIVFSMAFLAVCYIILPLISGNRGFFAIAFFTGLGWGIVMPVLNAVMFDVSPPRFQGLNLNLSLVMMQGGFFVGPLAGGSILKCWGYPALFYFCGLLSIIGAAFMLFRKDK